MNVKARNLVVAGLFVLGACGSEEDEELSTTTSSLVSDSTTGGTIGFFFLPPLVDTTPTFTGTFNGGYASRLKIQVVGVDCNNAGIVGAQVHLFNTVYVYPALQLYRVSTNATTIGLQNETCYRIIPKLDGAALGYRDVKVTNGAQPAGYRKIIPGTNFQIPFRLEGALDADTDGILNHVDNCPTVANPTQTDTDGDGIGDACDVADADGDGVPDSTDNCPLVFNPGQENVDGDSAGAACESCDTDPLKLSPGQCGCGTPDTDTDSDGTADCLDGCPTDPGKTAPGTCGCGVADTDTDSDGTADCFDGCPTDPAKTAVGFCGCFVPETDSDLDGRPNCIETCTP